MSRRYPIDHACTSIGGDAFVEFLPFSAFIASAMMRRVTRVQESVVAPAAMPEKAGQAMI